MEDQNKGNYRTRGSTDVKRSEKGEEGKNEKEEERRRVKGQQGGRHRGIEEDGDNGKYKAG